LISERTTAGRHHSESGCRSIESKNGICAKLNEIQKRKRKRERKTKKEYTQQLCLSQMPYFIIIKFKTSFKHSKEHNNIEHIGEDIRKEQPKKYKNNDENSQPS
jgi:hypothetical protein